MLLALINWSIDRVNTIHISYHHICHTVAVAITFGFGGILVLWLLHSGRHVNMATGQSSDTRSLHSISDNLLRTVRICVCGDEGTGKSSLISSLVKDVFVTTKIQAVLPQITIPPSSGTPENVTTTIVDTSALPQERNTLRKEVRKSNVILLVYSDHYSYERVALFWMPYFRSLGVNVPVVLCANKSDMSPSGNTAQVVEDEMLPVMAEFKEIDSCIRTSAREHHNINEVFFLCQKAVTHPIAPLFDAKESNLKPAAISALQRIFYLCDKDQDGYLNDRELHDFQQKCFDKPLADGDLSNIKDSISKYSSDSVSENGIDMRGFILLNKMFAEKGRHETIWIIVRSFHYTDSLSLKDSFLHPKYVWIDAKATSPIADIVEDSRWLLMPPPSSALPAIVSLSIFFSSLTRTATVD